uniref:Mitochondrial inner membrane protein OXA1L n=1 Tax=Lygus hesperus TaxID=30085 RepID=A0A146LG43_LYGHE
MGGAVCTFPFVQMLPCGIFVYWITSNVLSICINVASQGRWFTQFYNIPTKKQIESLEDDVEKRRLYHACILLNIDTPGWDAPPSIANKCLQAMTQGERKTFLPILDSLLGTVTAGMPRGELASTVNRKVSYVERIQQQQIFYSKLMHDLEAIRAQLSLRIPSYIAQQNPTPPSA